MYKSKIIGLIFIGNSESSFPLYLAKKRLSCTACGNAIKAGDTFTRDENYRRQMCKVCRPLIGETFLQKGSQSLTDMKQDVMSLKLKNKIASNAPLAECRLILNAAGFTVTANTLTEKDSYKMTGAIRTAYYKIAMTNKPAAARLRTLANTFLDKTI